MKDDADFIAKLQEIEKMATALGAHLDERVKTRAHHIAILARVLRGRLELGALDGRPREGGDPV